MKHLCECSKCTYHDGPCTLADGDDGTVLTLGNLRTTSKLCQGCRSADGDSRGAIAMDVAGIERRKMMIAGQLDMFGETL